MNDNNFDASQPIIPDSDSFEDIGVALTAGTSFSIDTQFTSGSSITNIASDGSKLYIVGRIGSSGSTNNVRRYTLTGTYESGGNATIANPPRPSSIASDFSFFTYRGLAYYNGSFYRIAIWTQSVSPFGIRHSLERYNTSFVHQSNVLVLNLGFFAVTNFDIFNDRLYFIENDGGAGEDYLRIRNLSDGSLVSGTNESNLTGLSPAAVTVSSDRIYTIIGSPSSIRAYNQALARVTADDTSYSGITFNDATIAGSNLYGVGSANNRFSVYPYSGITVPVVLDGNDQYRLTIPLPTNSRGSIQVSIKPRTFNIEGDTAQVGPATQQYLGTIDYDNSTIPYIANREYPQVLAPTATTMDIGIDFDQEVKGVDSDSFEIEPSTVRLIDSNVFSAVTPDPDVRPTVAARTVASTRATRAKYWRLRLQLPNPHPRGVINIWAKADTINND